MTKSQKVRINTIIIINLIKNIDQDMNIHHIIIILKRKWRDEI